MDSQESSGKGSRRAKAAENPLDAYLREIAKGAAGRPLSESLSEGAPLKQLIGRFVEIALEEEMLDHLGYEPHQRQAMDEEEEPPAQRSSRRTNTRNGRSRKHLKTSHGTTEINVPRDRAGSFDPKIVPKYGTITQEVEDRVVAMYASGMTTRDIQSHVGELYGIDASEMFVTRIVERLDPVLAEWRNRPLERLYAVVFIDALHLKVRRSGRVASTALYLVSGYGEGGTMDILGLYMAPEGESPAESASSWHQVLVELEKRGLADILILCSDQLAGLEAAAASVYPRARYQPCVVHILRASLRRVPWAERKVVAGEIKRIYQAATYEQAEAALEALDEQYGRAYPSLIRQWRGVLPRLSSLWQYSTPLRKLVYTINPMENLNRQVRKVTKNRGVFPHAQSAVRLASLVLMRIDRKQGARVRADWPRIASELAIHFPDRIPEDWGFRM